MATTLVISDLHLGGRTGADVLRVPEVRVPLLEALRGVDRLVLLGDILELRHGPVAEALSKGEPFFRDVAGARALDLDHLGAQVGERHRGERAGEDP